VHNGILDLAIVLQRDATLRVHADLVVIVPVVLSLVPVVNDEGPRLRRLGIFARRDVCRLWGPPRFIPKLDHLLIEMRGFA